MKVDFAILADAVTVRENLINILGGGLVNIGAYPAAAGLETPFGPAVATGARFTVGVRLLVSRGELGRPHKFESKISLPDGGELSRMEMQLMIPTQKIGEGQEAGISFGYQVVLGAIPQLGPYSVDIFLDGSHGKAIPFEIVMATSAQPPVVKPPD